MATRYQIFVSSTFVDLQEERQRVSRAILEMGHFPAGMELFPAADQEQFEFIKTIIDDCDYYVLIIGGRYGSVTSEGISFTEMEFDYARKIKKPILSFLHEDIKELPGKKLELAERAQEKLAAFRDRVSSDRMVKFWDSGSGLAGEVVMSLNHAIRQHPQTGWIRSDADQDSTLLKQIAELEKEYANALKVNKSLIDRLNDVGNAIDAEIELKIQGDEGPHIVTVRGIDILRHLAPLLYSSVSQSELKEEINEFVKHYSVDYSAMASPNAVRELLFYFDVFSLLEINSVSRKPDGGEAIYRINRDKMHIFKQVFKPKKTQASLQIDDEIPF